MCKLTWNLIIKMINICTYKYDGVKFKNPMIVGSNATVSFSNL